MYYHVISMTFLQYIDTVHFYIFLTIPLCSEQMIILQQCYNQDIMNVNVTVPLSCFFWLL